MTPDQAVAFLNYVHPALLMESQITRRVIAAIPDEKADYRPHSTNMTAGELARHIAFTEMWMIEGVINGEFAPPDDSGMSGLKPSGVLTAYEAQISELLDRVKSMPAEHLARETPFYVFKNPAVVFLDFCLKHSIHHRGQLSVYLRPMGAKVPCIYGGSADQTMAEAHQA